MGRKNFKNIIFFGCSVFLLAACKKDKPATNNKPLPADSTAQVLIACEGSLGNGNASLSVYSTALDSMYNDVFKQANKQDLGDVFQSITQIGNAYFLCINNSDKIVVLQPDNWLMLTSISVPKPRYILPVSANKAYVSSLFSNKLYVLNTASFAIEKTLEMPYINAEQMVLSGAYAYAASWDTASNKIYRIDIATDRITDSITLSGYAPQSIITDKDNKLWVMAGNAYKGKASSLHRIDPATKTILQSYHFPDKVEAIKPVFNPKGDTLYFIEVDYNGGTTNNGIYRMRYDAATLPDKAFISCTAFQYFWALGIDPNSGTIYIGDPKGFIQQGNVLLYRQDGTLLHQHKTGLGPGAFYFKG